MAATVGLRFLRTDDSNNSSGVGSVLLETGIGRFDHATDQEDGGDSYRKTLGISVLLTAELNWRGTGRGGFALRMSTGVLAALSHNIYDGDHHSWERYEVASLTTVSAGYAF